MRVVGLFIYCAAEISITTIWISSSTWVQFHTSNLQQFGIMLRVLPVLHLVNCITITCIYSIKYNGIKPEMNKIFWNRCLWCFRSIIVSWGPLSSFRYLRMGRSGSSKIVTFLLYCFHVCDITSLQSPHPKEPSADTALRAFRGWVPRSWLTVAF